MAFQEALLNVTLGDNFLLDVKDKYIISVDKGIYSFIVYYKKNYSEEEIIEYIKLATNFRASTFTILLNNIVEFKILVSCLQGNRTIKTLDLHSSFFAQFNDDYISPDLQIGYNELGNIWKKFWSLDCLIENLNLDNCKMGTLSFQIFFPPPNTSVKLKKLNLSRNYINNQTILFLNQQELSGLDQLEILYLDNNHIGFTEQLFEFTFFEKLPQIREIYLNYNLISDSLYKFKLYKNFTKCSRLQKIFLNYCLLTDSIIDVLLEQIKDSPSLIHIDLLYNLIENPVNRKMISNMLLQNRRRTILITVLAGQRNKMRLPLELWTDLIDPHLQEDPNFLW